MKECCFSVTNIFEHIRIQHNHFCLLFLYYWLTLLPDTEKPVIANCPSSGIVLNRYERLAGYLPILSVTDNTMVRDLTVSPRNARTTYYVEAPLTVIFTATDHAGNSASCSIPVTLRGMFHIFHYI
ncbi:hypothetical protein DPMN_035968 [Dreissena polymorpha]|uniref:HYR domain-containing protein n=1 Tax=Dreissena polymorpha TaxID=45954 RepID=A0A9D4RL23_DREPO|nr:hypothetical protein DPMN_035968 [Dreissena polymorpha]